MLRGVFVATVLLSLLAGCAAPNYQLANNKGQVARCSSFGAGVVGTLIAVSMAQTCVNEYQKQGYHQVPVSAPAAASAPSTSTDQAKKKQMAPQ